METTALTDGKAELLFMLCGQEGAARALVEAQASDGGLSPRKGEEVVRTTWGSATLDIQDSR